MLSPAAMRIYNALEDMSREYSRNPTPALKRRIDAAKTRFDELQSNQKNTTLKIRKS